MTAAASVAGFWTRRRTADELHQAGVLLLWSLPVAFTLLSAGKILVAGSAALAAAVCLGWVLLNPRNLLITLPFFALLSPVAGFFEVFGTSILLSDALFVFLGLQCVVLLATERIRLHVDAVGVLFGALAIIFMLSTVVGVLAGTLLTFKPALYLFQLVIVYLYTRTFCGKEERKLVIRAWTAATVLGALLLIDAYASGWTLIDFREGAQRQPPDTLLRATYYYGGFHLVLGVLIVMLALKTLLSSRGRIGTGAALLVLSFALLLMLQKTAIASVGAALLAAVLLLLAREVRNWRAIIGTAAVFALLGVLLFAAFVVAVERSQLELWIARTFYLGSFAVRLEVFESALDRWSWSGPVQLLIGWGPDFIEASGNPALSIPFRTSAKTGGIEGTVDSGWISYLIELGVLGLAVLLVLFVTSITATLKYLRSQGSSGLRDDAAPYVLGGLLFMGIALFGQMLGYSKLTWLPFQLLILGLMHERHAGQSSRAR